MIQTIGDLQKAIENIDDDFSISVRIVKEKTDEELRGSSYPYPYGYTKALLEIGDIGYSDKDVFINIEEAFEQMNWRDKTKIRLLADFKGSFFNEREEFIAHRHSNTYFIFSNCESLEDVNCKVLEWLSRAADRGIPYNQDWRNKKFQKFMLDGINMFLHTDFSKDDIDLIYTYLGNACNHNRTLEFVRSGYDMNLLKQLN